MIDTVDLFTSLLQKRFQTNSSHLYRSSAPMLHRSSSTRASQDPRRPAPQVRAHNKKETDLKRGMNCHQEASGPHPAHAKAQMKQHISLLPSAGQGGQGHCGGAAGTLDSAALIWTVWSYSTTDKALNGLGPLAKL